MTVDVHWLVAAIALMAGLLPLAVVIARGSLESAVVAMQQASTVGVLVLIALAQAFERRWFHDLAIVLALLSFAGTLALTRFIGRWL